MPLPLPLLLSSQKRPQYWGTGLRLVKHCLAVLRGYYNRLRRVPRLSYLKKQSNLHALVLVKLAGMYKTSLLLMKPTKAPIQTL